MLFVTDDATRYTWSVSYATKDEAPKLLHDLCHKIETTHNCKIRRVRFDNEFFKNSTTKWTTEKGINVKIIISYAHFQNGSAERNNRTVREKGSAMIQTESPSAQVMRLISEKGVEFLRGKEIPEKLWIEAFRYATYLKNRSPARSHKNKKTPYEALEGRKPDLSREHIWGSRAYVPIPSELRQGPKLHEARGWIGYFIGSESESIYRIWDPQAKKIKRVAIARVDDGEGIDDPQELPSRRSRLPEEEATVENVEDQNPENSEGSNDESSSSSDSDLSNVDEDGVAENVSRKAPDTDHAGMAVEINGSQAAKARYLSYFPNGYEVIPTSGAGMLCGVNAMINTITYLHKDIRRPTSEEFLILLKSEKWKHQMKDFTIEEATNPEDQDVFGSVGSLNNANFRVDQLSKMLRMWGEQQKPSIKLCLGYVKEEKVKTPILLSSDGDDLNTIKIVWIHNDGQEIVGQDNQLIRAAH